MNVTFKKLHLHVGAEVSPIDVLIQFSIAPLSVVQDALVGLGLRNGLEAAVLIEQSRILERLAEGRAPLLFVPQSAAVQASGFVTKSSLSCLVPFSAEAPTRSAAPLATAGRAS